MIINELWSLAYHAVVHHNFKKNRLVFLCIIRPCMHFCSHDIKSSTLLYDYCNHRPTFINRCLKYFYDQTSIRPGIFSSSLLLRYHRGIVFIEGKHFLGEKLKSSDESWHWFYCLYHSRCKYLNTITWQMFSITLYLCFLLTKPFPRPVLPSCLNKIKQPFHMHRNMSFSIWTYFFLRL